MADVAGSFGASTGAESVTMPMIFFRTAFLSSKKA